MPLRKSSRPCTACEASSWEASSVELFRQAKRENQAPRGRGRGVQFSRRISVFSAPSRHVVMSRLLRALRCTHSERAVDETRVNGANQGEAAVSMTHGTRPTIRVAYVTGNSGKFAEASFVFARPENSNKCDVMLAQFNVDTVEIQGTMEEIAMYKVKEAYRLLFNPDEGAKEKSRELLVKLGGKIDYILVEDVSLSLDALQGFPGPYCKPMLESIGPDGLWSLMSRYEDRHASVTCTLGVIDLRAQEKTISVLAGSLTGSVVAPRGNVQHGKASWNSVFQPDGCDKTFGELQYEEQAEISHRRKVLESFLNKIVLRD